MDVCKGLALIVMKFVRRLFAGGESTADNCQILQTRVNRFKSDKNDVDTSELKGYSCDVKFTGNSSSFPNYFF